MKPIRIEVVVDGKQILSSEAMPRESIEDANMRLAIEMANKALDSLGVPTQTEVHGEKRDLLLQGRIRALGQMGEQDTAVLRIINNTLDEAGVAKTRGGDLELSEAGRVGLLLQEMRDAHKAMDKYAPRFIAPSDTPLTLPERATSPRIVVKLLHTPNAGTMVQVTGPGINEDAPTLTYDYETVAGATAMVKGLIERLLAEDEAGQDDKAFRQWLRTDGKDLDGLGPGDARIGWNAHKAHMAKQQK